MEYYMITYHGREYEVSWEQVKCAQILMITRKRLKKQPTEWMKVLAAVDLENDPPSRFVRDEVFQAA
ncbi:MAG: hypothetical protein LBH13_00040 [Cellulomonadaceae bacterium]|jgi:hypothetical protein|nr:hypothetical protein [Cellulomonadaceae bacterium]